MSRAVGEINLKIRNVLGISNALRHPEGSWGISLPESARRLLKLDRKRNTYFIVLEVDKGLLMIRVVRASLFNSFLNSPSF